MGLRNSFIHHTQCGDTLSSDLEILKHRKVGKVVYIEL